VARTKEEGIMKFDIVFGVIWLIFGLVEIPFVESWALIGGDWFNAVVLKLFIAFLLFEIAYLEGKRGKKTD